MDSQGVIIVRFIGVAEYLRVCSTTYSCVITMDIQTFLHNLHEEVSCSVCMTKFTDPKQLPCLHSFCLHCLQRIQETSGIRETISCPECRQNFRIPGSGDLNALPTNFRINSLLDVLAIKECNTSGVKCGNCDKRSEKCSYCFQCCSFWCDDCLPFHNGIKANKQHHALALRDFQDEDFENILKQPTFCGNKGHENKELEFFCERCEVAICYSCVATLHDGHPKILLDEAANDRKMRANAAIDSRKQKLLQKRNKMARLQNSRVNIQAQVQRVKQNAQEFADKIIAAIEAKKQDIFSDAEAKGNELLEHLMIQLSEEEKDAKRTESSIERTETLLKRSTNADIVRLDKTLFETNSHAEEEQVSRDLEGQHQFIFDENKALLSKTNTEGIGTFRTSFLSKTLRDQSSVSGKGISECEEIYIGVETGIVVTKRNAKGEQCYEERDCVTMEIRNRQGHDCATIEQLQDNKDGTYKINYFAKETGACQASVKVNGEHVHGSPFEVQVQPRQYKPVISFGQLGSAAGMFNSPWGLAVNKKNEIVVTDTANHRMQIFDSDGHLLRSIGRKGSQQGELNWPAGIVFHNNDIIVADSGNNFIQLFTDQGEYVGQFGGYGSLDHQLKCPNGLSVDSSGNIIVADLGNKLIKIFSPDGHFLFKIGTEGSFVKPIHCIQHGNYFIVSDCGGHCVHVFNKEGKFLYKFGKKGNGDGEFNSPFFLSVNKADHLLVCDSGNHRVQVFELSGKFLTKFGTESNNLGSLNGPVSTAVLYDGRIVLADAYNHHIQIFQ